MTCYLQLTMDEGREFVALLNEDETIAEATERWVQSHPTMVERKRNREKAADTLRATISHRRIARPTSYWRRKAEREGLPFPVPPSGRLARRRKARS